MNGVSIIETESIENLIDKVKSIEEMFKAAMIELNQAKKPWMEVQETADYMRKSVSWVYQNKALLGFSKSGSDIIFNREKVDAYLWSVFFQSSNK